MNKIEVIRGRMKAVIDRERQLTERELAALREKQADEESYWGCGRYYNRYERSIDKREAHLSELMDLEKGVGSVVMTDILRLYPYYCPTCSRTVYLDSMGLNMETVDCPCCNRTIYRSAGSITWDVVKGSRQAYNKDGKPITGLGRG